MSPKKLGLALLAVLALSAVVANSAMATATESNGFWYKNGTKLTTGVTNALGITCSQVGELTLTWTIGTNETPLKLKATATTCPEGKIFNESSKAKATGEIRFTGMTFVEPVGCFVEGGELETVPVASQVYMEGTKALQRFAPAEGSTLAEFETSGCPLSGSYVLKGSFFGESVNATNVSSTEQNLKFSSAINSAAGGSLSVNGHAASITGQTKIELAAGGEFKANES